MGRCMIDRNHPKGAKCAQRYNMRCVGSECVNYAEPNFEHITVSPEVLAEYLFGIYENGWAGGVQNLIEDVGYLDWLKQPYLDGSQEGGGRG